MLLQQHKGLDDFSLRCALSRLMQGTACLPTAGAERGLRSLRDRISVPRDMRVHAARLLRQALEDIASLQGPGQGPPIPVRHRRDQDPAPFLKCR